MIAALRHRRRGAAAVIRAVLLAIVFAFSIGFGIGIWIRCALEKPEGYLASAADSSRAGAAPLPLHVGLTGAVVRDPGEHKE